MTRQSRPLTNRAGSMKLFRGKPLPPRNLTPYVVLRRISSLGVCARELKLAVGRSFAVEIPAVIVLCVRDPGGEIF